jgi:hypothetical protein
LENTRVEQLTFLIVIFIIAVITTVLIGVKILKSGELVLDKLFKKKKTTYSKGLASVELVKSSDTFEINQTLFLRINIFW